MSGTLDGSDEIGFLSLEIGEEITCAPIGPGPQARVKQRDGSIRLADTLLIRCRGRRHRQRDDEDIVVALAIGFDCATAVRQIQAMATARMAATDRPTVRIGRTAAGWQVTEPPRKEPRNILAHPS